MPMPLLEEKLKQVRAAVPAQVAMLEEMKVAKLMRMQLLLVAVRQEVVAKEMSMPLLELEEKLKQVRAAVSAQVAMLEEMQVARLMRMQLLLVTLRQGVTANHMSMPVLEVVEQMSMPPLELEKLKQVRAAVSAQVAMLEEMQVAKLMRMQLFLVAVRWGIVAKQMLVPVLKVVA